MKRTPRLPFPLVVIDQEQKLCRRYHGVLLTDEFEFESALTQEKVDGMRTDPEGTGTLFKEIIPSLEEVSITAGIS